MDQIMKLPKDYRNIIYLYYYEGYKIKEIAEILGKNQNTISSKLQRGRNKLKKILLREAIIMKEIYKNVLDKATLPKESKDNLKSLYDKVNQEDNVVSFEKKRNVKKPLAFVAAGLVCAVAVGSTFALGQFDNNNKTNSNGKTGSNSFVLNVNAAEISRKTADSNKSGSKSPKVTVGETGYVVSKGDDNDWYYDFSLPISCKGNNIDEITYTVNKGSITLYADEVDADSTLGSEDADVVTTEITDKKSETVSYKTLSKDKVVFLDVYGDSSSLSKSEQKILDKGLIPQADMEQYKKAMDVLLKDLKVTVKAKFNDGTTEEETINVNSKLVPTQQLDEIEKKVDSEENFKDSVEETKVESSNDNTNKTDEKDVCISVEVAK